jgi:hypothetical protein
LSKPTAEPYAWASARLTPRGTAVGAGCCGPCPEPATPKKTGRHVDVAPGWLIAGDGALREVDAAALVVDGRGVGGGVGTDGALCVAAAGVRGGTPWPAPDTSDEQPVIDTATAASHPTRTARR